LCRPARCFAVTPACYTIHDVLHTRESAPVLVRVRQAERQAGSETCAWSRERGKASWPRQSWPLVWQSWPLVCWPRQSWPLVCQGKAGLLFELAKAKLASCLSHKEPACHDAQGLRAACAGRRESRRSCHSRASRRTRKPSVSRHHVARIQRPLASASAVEVTESALRQRVGLTSSDRLNYSPPPPAPPASRQGRRSLLPAVTGEASTIRCLVARSRTSKQIETNRTLAGREGGEGGEGGGGVYSESYTRAGAIPNEAGPARCRVKPALNQEFTQNRTRARGDT
jgi:hypothetical protein